MVIGSLGEGRYWPMVRIGFIATLTPTSFKILLIFSVDPWMYESDVNLVNVGNSRCDLGFGGKCTYRDNHLLWGSGVLPFWLSVAPSGLWCGRISCCAGNGLYFEIAGNGLYMGCAGNGLYFENYKKILRFILMLRSFSRSSLSLLVFRWCWSSWPTKRQ